MKKAGIKHDWITYIPVDYSNESWVDKLLGAGFDKTKKTLFLWQSVSLYLEADIVKETLRKMADLCVDGSIIAQDFYSIAWVLLTFLGLLGAHRMYMSKWFTGVIYLLTGGIFGLGYLYDFWTLNDQISEINSSERWQ